MLRFVEGAPARLAAGVDDNIGYDARILVERAARHADGTVGCSRGRNRAARPTEPALVPAGRFVEDDAILARHPAEAAAFHLEIDAVLAARHLAAVRAKAADCRDDACVVELERDGTTEARSFGHENAPTEIRRPTRHYLRRAGPRQGSAQAPHGKLTYSFLSCRSPSSMWRCRSTRLPRLRRPAHRASSGPWA